MITRVLPVAILAGGLATRLRPITEKIPKSLVDINGEPFIAHQLRLLKKNGINHVVICVGYLGEMIRDFVGDGSKFGLEVDYSLDGPLLLGTGGALKAALPKLGREFFVVYGDSYLPCDYMYAQKQFIKSGKLSLMTLFHNKNMWDKSNVEFRDGAIIEYNKLKQTKAMEYIDYGLGIFNADAFKMVPDNLNYDLSELYKLLLQQDQLFGQIVTERFYEVGSHAGIKELSKYLILN